MPRLTWDETPESRKYETGVSNVVLYVKNTSGTYQKGVAWNGVTAISEKPTGGDTSAVYADNIKYLNITSTEDFAASIEAYTYPEEFEVCDGTVSLTTGVKVSQQKRRQFALCYKTLIGNADDEEAGYKIHVIYGCTASPSEKAYTTVNESREPGTFSWEITTTPISTGDPTLRNTAHIEINSLEVADETKMEALLDALYGKDAGSSGGTGSDPTLKTPAEIKAIVA